MGDAEKELKKVGAIESCSGNSYFVAYLTSKSEKDCLIEAKEKFNSESTGSLEGMIYGCKIANEGLSRNDCETKCLRQYPKSKTTDGCTNLCKKFAKQSSSDITHEEFCSKHEAEEQFSNLKKIHPNIAIIHNGEILEISFDNKNYISKQIRKEIRQEDRDPPIPVIDLGNTPDTNSRKLRRCEGDCDTDDQCEAGLKCYHRDDGSESIGNCIKNSSHENNHDYCSREIQPINFESKDFITIESDEVINRVWYGDPKFPFDTSYGLDVTDSAKEGKQLVASDTQWGNAQKGVRKVLIVEARVPPELLQTRNARIFRNYSKELYSKLGGCNKCEYASKILCSENNMLDTKHSHFENSIDKTQLAEYCSNLSNNTSFKCERYYRQKFVYKKKKSDFCLDTGKVVYLSVSNSDEYGNLVPLLRSDTTNNSNVKKNYPVDNLLGETYSDYFHIFIKGVLAPDINNKHKFNIVFNTDKLTGINNDNINILKSNSNIILDYTSEHKDIKIGDKVLVRYQINDDETHAYKNRKLSVTFDKSEVRWMGVVIKKLKNNLLKVMLSINSYESNSKYMESVKQDRARPFKTTNPIEVYNINDVILIRKAPICV